MGGTDHEVKALETFTQMKLKEGVDFKRVNDEDTIIEALKGAKNLDEKKMLMRYKRLKKEVEEREPIFVSKAMKNMFPCIKKFGKLYKKADSWLGGW